MSVVLGASLRTAVHLIFQAVAFFVDQYNVDHFQRLEFFSTTFHLELFKPEILASLGVFLRTDVPPTPLPLPLPAPHVSVTGCVSE